MKHGANPAQSSSRAHFAGIAIRIIYLIILTALLIVSGFVYLENSELHKLLAPTPWVRVAILLGHALAIVGANYFLGLRGNNLTDTRTETYVMASAIFASLGALGPYALLVEVGVAEPPLLLSWFQAPRPILGPNLWLYLCLVPSMILFIVAIKRIMATDPWDRVDQ